MSRSGYNDWDCEGDANLYRANVDRAIAGKRGQAMLRALRDALEAMPEKRLVDGEFHQHGEVCAFGALGRARGLDMKRWDELAADDQDEALAYELAKAFNIPEMLAREVMYENDDGALYVNVNETPTQRYARVKRWVDANIIS